MGLSFSSNTAVSDAAGFSDDKCTIKIQYCQLSKINNKCRLNIR